MWLAWTSFLVLVTWALLSPQPPKVGAAVLPSSMTFGVSKAIHLGVYFTLAVTIVYLPASLFLRRGVWTLLAIHAGATEYLQQFVEGRSGSIRDVGINLTGLILGMVLARWLSRGRLSPGGESRAASPPMVSGFARGSTGPSPSTEPHQPR